MPADSPVSPEGSPVTFVADRGWGSMASCSRYLARQLGVRVLFTSAYERAAMLDGLGLLNPRSLLGFAHDAGFVRALRRAEGCLIHLSNHHLAPRRGTPQWQ
jgi:hypothetical protein